MDCKNVNLEELLKKAKDYDNLIKERDDLKYQKIELGNELFLIKDFLLVMVGDGSYLDTKSHEGLKKIFAKIADKEGQGYKLAQERQRHNEEFYQQMQELENGFKYKEEELSLAWEKFRAIQTKRYQQTLKEINEEVL